MAEKRDTTDDQTPPDGFTELFGRDAEARSRNLRIERPARRWDVRSLAVGFLLGALAALPFL